MVFGTRYQTWKDECDTGLVLLEGPASKIHILIHSLSNEDDFIFYSTSRLGLLSECVTCVVPQGPALKMALKLAFKYSALATWKFFIFLKRELHFLLHWA